MERYMNKIVIILMSCSIIFCQPGKARGPGGQYENRMEMMMVWKLTDYLNLSEQQAEKLFPRMRNHRVEIGKYHKDEKELFDSYLSMLKKMETLSQKKSNNRIKFIRSTSDILEPNQQIMFMSFEPYMKEQAQKGIKENFRKGPKPRTDKGKRRR